MNSQQSPCPSCGAITAAMVRMPEGHVHYAKLECLACGRFLRWLPKPRPAAVGRGSPPPEIMSLVHARTSPVPLRGTPGQVSYAASVRSDMLRRIGDPLRSVALCVADASWFIANKDRPATEIRWPSPAQMEPEAEAATEAEAADRSAPWALR